MLENRRKVIKWLNEIEQQYEVQDIIIQDLHVWPILRWTLFKDIVKREGYVKEKLSSGRFRRGFKNFFQYSKGFFNYLRILLGFVPHSQVLFAGSQNYRVDYLGKSINRFFDPLTQILKNNNVKFINADYSRKNRSNYSYEDSHFSITSVFYFYKNLPIFKTPRDLEENPLVNEIINLYNKNFEADFTKTDFYNKVRSVLIWAEIYEKLVKATNCKLCLALCYYNEAMYGLNLACYRTGVNSVDIQHGPQGVLHAAYTGFTKIPVGGYSSLPKYFWVWDEKSFKSLKYRLERTGEHHVFLGGNPWIWFLSSQIEKEEIVEGEKFILFSLQPILPFLPEIILDAISSTPKGFIWWIRMHPRMTPKDKREVKATIRNRGLDHLVNFEEANNLALPLVLKKSALHISKSSGCVIEASMIGTPNIIVDPLGAVYFSDLIDNKMNFTQTVGNLWPLIEKIIGNKINRGNGHLIDVEKTIDLLISDLK